MCFGNLPGDEAPEDLPHIELDRLPGDEHYDPTDTDGDEQLPMCRFGAHRRCAAEDCVCCEVYLEQRTEIMYGSDPSERDEYDDDRWDEDEDTDLDDVDESMDGDFDTGMASAGYGTDEDYGHFGDDSGDWE